MYETLHGVKKGIKDIVAPQGLFEDLGLKYLGPVDGHDEQAIESGAAQGPRLRRPGARARAHPEGPRLRPRPSTTRPTSSTRVGVINPETGLPLEIAGRSWTDEFSDEMVRIGAERPDVVAITAAMMIPVGLDGLLRARFPDRIFDVGIAEQHAVTMASGLAFAGLHPVVAVYATFLNRAFDQLLMDCALHQAGVTFVLDRAGVTGSDGASHNGMWDMAIGGDRAGPAARRAAGRRAGAPAAAGGRRRRRRADGAALPQGRRGRADHRRWSSGAASTSCTARATDPVDLLLVGVGSMASTAMAVAEKLQAQGRTVRVVDPRWVLPVSDDLVEAARAAGAVAVVEDNLVSCGIGAAVTVALRDAGLDTPVHLHGIPKEFLDHASRGQVLEQVGLTADSIATSLAAALSR